MLQLNNIFEIYWTLLCDFPQGSISAITKQMRRMLDLKSLDLQEVIYCPVRLCRLVFPGAAAPRFGMPRKEPWSAKQSNCGRT